MDAPIHERCAQDTPEPAGEEASKGCRCDSPGCWSSEPITIVGAVLRDVVLLPGYHNSPDTGGHCEAVVTIKNGGTQTVTNVGEGFLIGDDNGHPIVVDEDGNIDPTGHAD
jgi:hypothetical protein